MSSPHSAASSSADQLHTQSPPHAGEPRINGSTVPGSPALHPGSSSNDKVTLMDTWDSGPDLRHLQQEHAHGGKGYSAGQASFAIMKGIGKREAGHSTAYPDEEVVCVHDALTIGRVGGGSSRSSDGARRVRGVSAVAAESLPPAPAASSTAPREHAALSVTPVPPAAAAGPAAAGLAVPAGPVMIAGPPPSLALPKMPPAELLRRILVVHQYDVQPVHSLQTSPEYYHRKPTAPQVSAYTMELVRAVRSSELGRLKELQREGRSMDACNQFGESVLHMACRRGAHDLVAFLLHDCGLRVDISDDFGRTPLHDACWTSEAHFEVVGALLNADRHLVAVADSRASLPLTYVHEDQWGSWCEFLVRNRNVWWAAVDKEEWNEHLSASRNSNVPSAAASAPKAASAASAPKAASPVLAIAGGNRSTGQAGVSLAPGIGAGLVGAATPAPERLSSSTSPDRLA